MHFLIWWVMFSSLCSYWLGKDSLWLWKVKCHLLISLPHAHRLHCNSNLSYFAMDIFLSVRIFYIFTPECVSGMQGLFEALNMELWWEKARKSERLHPWERHVPGALLLVESMLSHSPRGRSVTDHCVSIGSLGAGLTMPGSHSHVRAPGKR